MTWQPPSDSEPERTNDVPPETPPAGEPPPSGEPRPGAPEPEPYRPSSYGAQPPEAQPPYGAQPSEPQPPYGAPPPEYQAPEYQAPSYQPPPEYPPPSAYPPPAYPPPPGAGFPPGAPGYPGYPAPPRRTNGLAVAAIICSIGGFFTGISAPVGAVLGHMATKQIAQTGEEGEGLAKAAIIIGWAITGLIVLACCVGAIVIFAAAGTL
jgi:Domain of unknown function (DUF4190)